jgi:hypothetical protein
VSFAPTSTKRIAALLPAVVAAGLAAAPLPVGAYRPFDSTDADVAGPGEAELELGTLGYLRQGSERFLSAPSFSANFGLADRRELVLEGQVRSRLDAADATRRTSIEDIGVFLKQVHRPGSVQGQSGPSLASECGVLLPSIGGQSGAGARCTGIVSQRWQAATTHVNAALAWTREHRPELFLGWIVEGPNDWPLRPAMEIFTDRERGAALTHSSLAGLVWRASDTLAIDLGIRSARTDGVNVSELRAGLTWTFSTPTKP